MNRPTDQAFTLIELLVVVAIIAILITLLVPSIASVRKKAETMACMEKLREIGRRISSYAMDHEGRFPGSGHRYKPSSSSISWVDILNFEQNLGGVDWGNKQGWKHMPIQRMGMRPDKFTIYCPAMAPYGTLNHSRAYVMSSEATGGGGRAKKVDPPRVPGLAFDVYRLGAQVGGCARPSSTHLVVENMRANDGFSASGTIVNIGSDSKYPPWSGSGGVLAFRHDFTMNVLFMDYHVENVGPATKFYSWR